LKDYFWFSVSSITIMSCSSDRCLSIFHKANSLFCWWFWKLREIFHIQEPVRCF